MGVAVVGARHTDNITQSTLTEPAFIQEQLRHPWLKNMPAEARREMAELIRSGSGSFEDRNTSAKLLHYGQADRLVDLICDMGHMPNWESQWGKANFGFQPAPMHCVEEMIRQAPITERDVFYDIGCGPGAKVVHYVALRTGALSKGVELSPAYCHHASEVSRTLGLQNTAFLNADATNLDYADGSVFFLFNPMYGKNLEQLIERLKEAAKRHPITVCSLGTCSLRLNGEGWLENRKPDARLKLTDLVILQSRPEERWISREERYLERLSKTLHRAKECDLESAAERGTLARKISNLISRRALAREISYYGLTFTDLQFDQIEDLRHQFRQVLGEIDRRDRAYFTSTEGRGGIAGYLVERLQRYTDQLGEEYHERSAKKFSPLDRVLNQVLLWCAHQGVFGRIRWKAPKLSERQNSRD